MTTPEEWARLVAEAEVHVDTWTDEEWLLVISTLAPETDVSVGIALVEAHREAQAS